jgi:hypothetical protein
LTRLGEQLSQARPITTKVVLEPELAVQAIWDPEIQEEQLQASLDQVISQAESRGEVEDVGLGQEWRHAIV